MYVIDSAGRKKIISSPNINGLTEETAVAAGDFVPIYDVSAAANRKMQQTNLIPDASDTVKGKQENAVQSEQETGTSTTLTVTPGVQKFHPSAAKFWVNFEQIGTQAIVGTPYNVDSIADNGTGDTTVTIGTDFSSTAYCVVTNAWYQATSFGIPHQTGFMHAAGTYRITNFNLSSTATDMDTVQMVGFGDQV